VYKAKDTKEKNIRSGAAKIVEIVAELKPELVASHLEKLLPARQIYSLATTGRFQKNMPGQFPPYLKNRSLMW